ncbi:MAG: DUF1413 domain-containing protein [Ruminococcus sp.]|nr:DUF1413 domain-containing protein [Ruminococcus sp.]
MALVISGNLYVGDQSITQFLQNKIDKLKIGDEFTLADLCKPELSDKDLSHLGVDFKHFAETNQFRHIEFVETRSDGVALYRRTEFDSPFQRIIHADR